MNENVSSGISEVLIRDVNKADENIYYQVKKKCCERSVKKYFGKWDEKEQLIYNNKIFAESLKQTCFKKIVLNHRVVGFFGYTLFEKEVGCVTLQIENIRQRRQVFETLLRYLIKISTLNNLPIFAKSFLNSDDIKLYQKAGFEIMSKTNSHYLLRRGAEKIMIRKDYEKLIREKFKGNTKEIMLEQVGNFYSIAEKSLANKKYRKGDDVCLSRYNLMTGFKLDLDYLEKVSKEGKICGDYAGIETERGVKWAVSTWKFAKRIKLKDYITNYSGMTVVYNGIYEIVPYGKLDSFVDKLKKKEHFLWEAESTREMRFLPNDIRDNGNIALIFNMKHEGCDKLMYNELQQAFMPDEIRLAPNPNERNKTRVAMEKGFGERCAYVMFGIPRNCIEGLFVNRKTERNTKLLKQLKSLFPDCYICNLDGKVVVE